MLHSVYNPDDSVRSTKQGRHSNEVMQAVQNALSTYFDDNNFHMADLKLLFLTLRI